MTALACPHYLFTIWPCGLKQNRTFWNKCLLCISLSDFMHWVLSSLGQALCLGGNAPRQGSEGATVGPGCPASPGDSTAVALWWNRSSICLEENTSLFCPISTVLCYLQGFNPTSRPAAQCQAQEWPCPARCGWARAGFVPPAPCRAGQLCWAPCSCRRWAGTVGLAPSKSTLAAPLPGTGCAVLPPVLLTGVFQLRFHFTIMCFCQHYQRHVSSSSKCHFLVMYCCLIIYIAY